MLEKFIENFLVKSRASQGVYVERISSGGFKTLSEYKLVVGKLKGLQESEYLIKELYKSMIEQVDYREYREIQIENEPESY